MTRCSHKTREGRVCKNKTCNSLKVCNVHSKVCPICFDITSSGEEVCTLICGHAYHTPCIYPWFTHSHQCPYCRRSVRRPKITIEVDSTINMTPRLNDAMRDVLNRLFDSDELPSGHIFAFNEGGRIIMVDGQGNRFASLVDI